jgi:2-dehydropantoate 2-reductase
MKIAVIGAGALGSLLAGLLKLAEPAAEIWLVGGPHSRAQLAAIEKQGLTLELAPAVARDWPGAARFGPALHGLLPVQGLRLAYQPDDLPGPVDLALVAVKSYQTAAVAPHIAALLAPDGLAVTLQNGLGNLELLQAALGLLKAAQGVTALGATWLEPGKVRFTGPGLTTFARPDDPGPENPRLLELAALLERADLPVAFNPDLSGLLWGKLVVNCAINPLTALLDCPNGALLQDPASRELMEAVATETAGIARTAGIHLPYPYDQAAAQAARVAGLTSANISSMLADVRRGSPTEIEAINGAVVREAARLGVSAPLNRTLYLLVRALTRPRF